MSCNWSYTELKKIHKWCIDESAEALCSLCIAYNNGGCGQFKTYKHPMRWTEKDILRMANNKANTEEDNEL